MAELVSILIPAHNEEKWIGPAIMSALQQTWPNKEIIVVDDGSADRTWSIAQQFESKSVKLVKQESRGASAARNNALSLAQGAYIQWLDADDLLARDKVSRQMRCIDNPGNSRLLLSSAWGRFYFSPKRAAFIPSPLWQDLDPAEWLFRKLYYNAWMSPHSWLVSRTLTEITGPWDEQMSMDDDGEYFSRMVAASDSIKFIADAKSYKRIGNTGSLSSEINLSARKQESQFKSICRHIEQMRSLEDSRRTREACLRYLQRELICFYPGKKEILEKANCIARELGGTLYPPTLKLSYRPIQKIFGWDAAKQAQGFMKKAKIHALTCWNRLLSLLSGDEM